MYNYKKLKVYTLIYEYINLHKKEMKNHQDKSSSFA